MRLIDADRININEGCRKKMRKDEVRCNENAER